MIESISSDHRELFSDLYAMLTEDEGNALLNSLEEIEAPIDYFVHRQGEANNALFFITKGKLRIGINKGGKRFFVKILFPGDIFGLETFFSSSNCTASIISFVPTTLYRLDKANFQHLKTKYPGLEKKLKNFCHQVDTVSSHVQRKKMDRREKKREPISGNAVVQFFSNSGNLVGDSIRVKLSDISIGGTSFIIKLSNEGKVDIMLGRKLLIQYRMNDVPFLEKIQKEGIIVAIRPMKSGDASFHLQFDQDLTDGDFSRILSIGSTTH